MATLLKSPRIIKNPKRSHPIICRWCGTDPAEDPKVALTRVNKKGVPGIWECAPYCSNGGSSDGNAQ
jgi:hypothetical protein